MICKTIRVIIDSALLVRNMQYETVGERWSCRPEAERLRGAKLESRRYVQKGFSEVSAFHWPSLDCSIIPSNVGANLYNTALAIGERAAVIIAEDLGIDGVAEED